MTISTKLKNYLIQLPILGLVGVLSALFFIVPLFASTEYWTLNSLPFKILGIIIAYLLINHVSPGGNVNFNFVAHDTTKDEKQLSTLIASYRSRWLIALTAFVFIIANTGIGRVHYISTNTLSFNDVFFSIVFVAFISMALLEGIKYLTAWWNIRRHINDLEL